MRLPSQGIRGLEYKLVRVTLIFPKLLKGTHQFFPSRNST